MTGIYRLNYWPIHEAENSCYHERPFGDNSPLEQHSKRLLSGY